MASRYQITTSYILISESEKEDQNSPFIDGSYQRISYTLLIHNFPSLAAEIHITYPFDIH